MLEEYGLKNKLPDTGEKFTFSLYVIIKAKQKWPFLSPRQRIGMIEIYVKEEFLLSGFQEIANPLLVLTTKNIMQ